LKVQPLVHFFPCCLGHGQGYSK